LWLDDEDGNFLYPLCHSNGPIWIVGDAFGFSRFLGFGLSSCMCNFLELCLCFDCHSLPKLDLQIGTFCWYWHWSAKELRLLERSFAPLNDFV